MTTPNNDATVASVLSNALRPIRSQLDLALSQSTGTLHASIESALSLTDQVETLVLEQADNEVEEFNALYDNHVALNESFTTQGLLIASLKESLEEQRVLVSEANANAEMTNARLRVTAADKHQLSEQNARFASMNPERQKVQIVSLKQTIADKTKLLDQQRGEIRKSRTEAADSQTRLAVMVQQNVDLAATVDDLQKRLQRVDGDVEPVWYKAADDSGLQFYFYTFSWRLSLGSSDRDLAVDILNDIDWHIEIRTNAGISVLVTVTQWCRARFPVLEQFRKAWPSTLGSALNERITELLAGTHSHLVERAEWAQTVQLSSLPLKANWLDLLNGSDIFTLYTVVSHTPEELSNLVKGFGMPTARQVHAACMNEVKSWQAKNWQTGRAA